MKLKKLTLLVFIASWLSRLVLTSNASAYMGCERVAGYSYYAGACRTKEEITGLMNANRSGLIGSLKEVYGKNIYIDPNLKLNYDAAKTVERFFCKSGYNNDSPECTAARHEKNMRWAEYQQQIGAQVGATKYCNSFPFSC